MKTTYTTFIAVSKDGFIADKDGSTAFLHSENVNITGDGGYTKYYSQIDGLIYGSSTYKTVKEFGLKTWPYEGKKEWVLTSRPSSFKHEGIKFVNKDPLELDKEVDASHVWVMGGANVIKQYIDSGLLKQMTICYLNKDIKEGIKLFKDESLLKNWKIIKEELFGDLKNITYKKEH